jgi:hypothetical protein
MKRAISILCLGAVLAACGDRQTRPAQPASSEAAEPAPVGEIEATDQFGPFASPVTGIAFWTHPSLSFQGMVLASSADGLAAFNVEDGAEVARIEGVAANGVNVVYAGGGAEARGFAIALDASTGEFRYYEIDNASRSLSSAPATGATNNRAAAFCSGADRDGALRLIALNGAMVETSAIEIGEGGVRVELLSQQRAPQGVVACVVDPLDGAVFLAGESGAIYRMALDGNIDAKVFAESGLSHISSIGLMLHGLVEAGPTEECCGEIAVLDAADGSVRLIDRDDGQPSGAARIISSFDVEGVATATAMGVGYGNFGGIYRDGILALATDGDSPAVRLAPLNGVMDAISAPMGPTAEPRNLSDQAEEDDGLVIDVHLVAE